MCVCTCVVSHCQLLSCMILARLQYLILCLLVCKCCFFHHQLLEFDQAEFFIDVPKLVSMDSVGYVYVPTACKDKSTSEYDVRARGSCMCTGLTKRGSLCRMQTTCIFSRMPPRKVSDFVCAAYPLRCHIRC